jgi:hypothetical protein
MLALKRSLLNREYILINALKLEVEVDYLIAACGFVTVARFLTALTSSGLLFYLH